MKKGEVVRVVLASLLLVLSLYAFSNAEITGRSSEPTLEEQLAQTEQYLEQVNSPLVDELGVEPIEQPAFVLDEPEPVVLDPIEPVEEPIETEAIVEETPSEPLPSFGTQGFGTQGFTIQALPVVDSINLTATSDNNLTTDNLTLQLTITDADGDNFTNITDWRVNSTSIALLNLPFVNGSSNDTSTTDYSTLGNTFNLVTDVTFNATSGHDGFGAFRFNGSSENRIQTDTSTALNLNFSEDFSVELWMNTLQTNFATVLISRQATGGNVFYSFVLNSGGGDGRTPGSIHWELWNFASEKAISSTNVTDGEWHHIVGTHNASSNVMALYVDGVLEDTNTTTDGTFAINTRVTLGNNDEAVDQPFNGSIGVARVYNRTLSAPQIALLANNRTDIIASTETSVGNVWQACVTPNDGQDGTETCSNNLTILAAPASVVCGVINASTTMNQDLTASEECFTINADDVVLDCAGFSILYNSGGGNSNASIRAENRNNITVRNCNIRDINASGSSDRGIAFTNITNSSIINNVLVVNGTSSTEGISVNGSTDSSFVTITNNTILAVGSAGSNTGVHIRGNGHNITNNSITVNGTNNNIGINSLNGANSSIELNTITAAGATGGATGIQDTTMNALIQHNTIIANGAGANQVGMRLNGGTTILHNNVINTTGSSTTNYGILTTNLQNATIANGTISTNGTSFNDGIRTGGTTRNVTITGMLIIANGTVADNSGVYHITGALNTNVYLQNSEIRTYGASNAILTGGGSRSLIVSDTILNNSFFWIRSQAGLDIINLSSNVSFVTPEGSIQTIGEVFFQTQLRVNQTNLNVTNNRAFLNSTQISPFNVSAEITLNNASFANPELIVDFNDDGVFETCPGNVCTLLSTAGNTVVFNVTRFTTFSVQAGSVNVSLAKTDNPDPVNAGNSLNYAVQINVSGTAIDLNFTDIFPGEVVFANSSPPANFSNTTWLFGNVTNQNLTINITVVVNASIANGTLINNTANITFQNSTGANISAQVVENTTVISSAVCPGTITTNTNITENVTASGTCVTFGANHITLDCLGNHIFWDSAGGGADAITGNVRSNITVQNCNLQDINAAGTGGEGMRFTFLSASRIINNTVQTNGVSGNNGLFFQSSINHNVIANNTILTTGSSSGNMGIRISSGTNNTITQNNISTNGTGSDYGIYFTTGVSSSSIISNTILANGTGGDNEGIIIEVGTSDNNFVAHNVVTTDGNGAGNGGIQIANSQGNNVTNNTVLSQGTNSNFGILLSGSSEGRITDNTVTVIGTSFGSIGLRLQSTAIDNIIQNNFLNATSDGSTGFGIETNGGVRNNTFNNTILYTNRDWFAQSASTDLNNTFENTTFATREGSITVVGSFTINGTQEVNQSNLNITRNNAFLDSIEVPYLNQSGIVTLNSIDDPNSQPIVDFNDNGQFQFCGLNICTGRTFSGNTLSYNVTRFTTYSSTIGGVNITLSKSDDPDPVNTSEALTYQINLTINNGTAFNGVINDTFPPQVTFANASPTPDAGNNSWNVGNLTIGETFQINITVLVNSGVANNTVINNTANFTFQNSTNGNLSASVLENTTVFAGPPVNNTLGVTLTKADSPDPANVSRILNYTVEINVSGTAVGVNLTDTFPPEVVFLNATPPANISNTTWLFGNVSNTSIRVNITVVVNASIENGTLINNTANLTFQNVTGGNLSLQDIENTTVLAEVLLVALSKNDTPDPAVASGFVNYVILVNVTSGTAFNATLVDTLPVNATFVNATPTPDAGTNNTFSLGNITGVSLVTVNITVRALDNLQNGTLLQNFANLTFRNLNNDTLNRTAQENTTVLFVTPVVNVTKTDDPDPAIAGQQLNYSILVNVTNGTAINVTLVDTLPDNTSFVSSTVTPVSGTNTTFSLGNISQGSTSTVNITVSVNNNVTNATVLRNLANVTFSDILQNNFSAADQENTSVLFEGPLLVVIKSDNPDPVLAGQLLAYNIVINVTNGSVVNATLVDFLPSNVTFINASPTPVSGTNNTFNLGNLSNGTVVEVNITVRPFDNLSNSTVLLNIVNVTFPNSTLFAGVSDTEDTTVQSITPTLTIAKTDNPDPVEPSGLLNYTITVTVVNGTAFNVTVNDTFPAEVIFNTSSPAPSSGNNTFSFGTLTAGQSVTVNITVNATNATDGSTLVNNASVFFRNATSAEFVLNATESTTVQATAPPAPAPSGGGGGGGGGAGRAAVGTQIIYDDIPPGIQSPLLDLLIQEQQLEAAPLIVEEEIVVGGVEQVQVRVDPEPAVLVQTPKRPLSVWLFVLLALLVIAAFAVLASRKAPPKSLEALNKRLKRLERKFK